MLNAYYALDIVLDAGNTAMNKTDKNPYPLHSSVGWRQEIRKISRIETTLDGAKEKNKAGKGKKLLAMGGMIFTFRHGDSEILTGEWQFSED